MNHSLLKHVSYTLLILLIGLQNSFATSTFDLNTSMPTLLQTYATSENVSQLLVAVSVPNQKTLVVTNTQANLDKPYFPIASITKTFTASLILTLMQQQKLKLTDTLGQYFPQYPDWHNISLQMLLDQTSGLPDYTNAPNFFVQQAEHPNHLYSAAELLSLAYTLKPTFNPGQGWAYSNTNYLLLGLIAEKITGKPLATLYNHYLFGPLDLAQTVYSAEYYPKKVQTNIMPGFFKIYPATPNNMTWAQGAGGIASTTPDLIRWRAQIYRNNLNHYFDFIQKNRVSLRTGQPLQNLNTPSYGFGVFAVNTPYGMMWYTPGLASGYNNMLIYFPCQDVLIADSINNGPVKIFALDKLVTLIMQTVLQDPDAQKAITNYQLHHTLPAYCQLPRPGSIKLPIF